MNINYCGLVKLLAVSSAGLMLSGCFSVMLATNSGYKEKYEQWKSDTITGLSMAQDNEGHKGYVFVGKTFDYLLSEGGDDVVKMLRDPRLDRHNMEVTDTVKFALRYDKKQFTGELALRYQLETQEEMQAVLSYGFYCSGESCSKTVSGLRGSIHKKNKKQNYSQDLAFYHPFTVEFYEHKTSGMSPDVASALYPVALTLDIVTSPLQLVGFGILAGVMSSS